MKKALTDVELKIVRDLFDAYGPSGDEGEVQAVFKKFAMRCGLRAHTLDALGNVSAVVNPGGTPVVMVAAHADEIRLVVQSITEDGFIYLSDDESFDLSNLPGRSVVVLGSKGSVEGVIGRVSYHDVDRIIDREDPESLRIHDMWVDVGVSSKKAVHRLGISRGDAVLINEEFAILQGDVVRGRCVDNRAGLSVLAFAMKRAAEDLRRGSPAAYPAVHFVSSVQEENDPLLMMGVKTAAHIINPDIAVIIDVTQAYDYPAFDDFMRAKFGNMRVGGGPVIARGPSVSPIVSAMLQRVAKDLRIPCQIEASSAAHGGLTEANLIQRSGTGVATGLLEIATRYLHHPIAVCSLRDVKHCAHILRTFFKNVCAEEDFRPW